MPVSVYWPLASLNASARKLPLESTRSTSWSASTAPVDAFVTVPVTSPPSGRTPLMFGVVFQR